MIPQVVAAATADQLRRIVRLNEWHLVGLTILFSDHLFTLDTEINLLWRRRKSLSAYWFYINRYFGVFSGIAVSALPFLTLSLEMCIRYSLFRELVLVVAQTINSIIMVIRVYALYGRSRRILWGLFLIGLVVVAVTIYSFSQQHASRPTVVGGCHFDLTESTSHHFAASWIAIVAFDALIFGLTLYNAYINRRRTIPSTSLHMIVLRDGSVYFAIMATANLANILTYYLPALVSPGSLSTFANSISVTMISRMILNLHQHANVGIMSEPTGVTAQANDLDLGDLSLTEPDFDSELYSGTSRPDVQVVSVVSSPN
ncbi:hypothetical protein B0H19DRAFT_1130033 [Mycena capillaripes]|nr:hypothetical protein B0H19DRAFT_1130033 [Mycena capillaripes]